MNKLRDFLQLSHYYFTNQRLNEYSSLLEVGCRKGYEFCTVYDSLARINSGVENLICIRHDVDEISPGTLQLARIENRCGIQSTYYFRLSTVSSEVISEIVCLGHEVSYHYETIAEYVRKYGIRSRSELEGRDYLSECVERLLESTTKFRANFDVPCRTLASHGAPENRLLGLSNASLFQNMPSMKTLLDIDVECYEDAYLSEWDAYVSDSPVEFNNGYRYGVSPLSLIKQKTRRIMFLSHPNHWGFSMTKRAKRLLKVGLTGMKLTDDQFAYNHKLRGRY